MEGLSQATLEPHFLESDWIIVKANKSYLVCAMRKYVDLELATLARQQKEPPELTLLTAFKNG